MLSENETFQLRFERDALRERVTKQVKEIDKLKDEISELVSNGTETSQLMLGLDAENQRLKKEIEGYREEAKSESRWADDYKEERDNLQDVIGQITRWVKAYPLDVFPPLGASDFRKIRDVLKDTGVTLDQVSASNMRHVLKGIEDIITKNLKVGGPQ